MCAINEAYVFTRAYWLRNLAPTLAITTSATVASHSGIGVAKLRKVETAQCASNWVLNTHALEEAFRFAHRTGRY
jgi:hypothetical protein